MFQGVRKCFKYREASGDSYDFQGIQKIVKSRPAGFLRHFNWFQGAFLSFPGFWKKCFSLQGVLGV